MTEAAVEPRPAATVVLLRPGPSGLEALLTHRPASMAFAADMHVFPGGRVDTADADPRLVARSSITPAEAATALGGELAPETAHAAYVAAIREAFEEVGVLLADAPADADLVAARDRLLAEPASFPDLVETLDLRLRTDLLVPLSRWVTPPTLARRFDARFFAAALPVDVEATLIGEEVAAHAWSTARAALDAMAAGSIGMWLPTSATLQQLEHAGSIDDIRRHATPGILADTSVEVIDPEVTRITMPAAGGVAGQPVHAYLVGRQRFVLVDPGEPTGPALDCAIELAAERGGRIAAVALTQVDPDHAAGAEALAEMLSVPVLASPVRAADLPYDPQPLADGDTIDLGDVPLRVVVTPGPTTDHLALIVGDGAMVLSGDLDGTRGTRSIPAPTDDAAITASRARLHSIAPDATWLGGHPTSR